MSLQGAAVKIHFPVMNPSCVAGFRTHSEWPERTEARHLVELEFLGVLDTRFGQSDDIFVVFTLFFYISMMKKHEYPLVI